MTKKAIYFIRCTHCGAWRYTLKVVKTLKCLTCNKTFTFAHAIKEIYNVDSLKYCPEIIKRLKIKDAKELDPYLNFEYEDQKN